MTLIAELSQHIEDDVAPNGINVCGYLRTESGVGAATRGYIRALRTLGIPIGLKDLSGLCISRADDKTVSVPDDEPSFDINLVCVEIEKHNGALSQIGEDRFDACYNIAVWWWELMRFPQKWYDKFAYYDEIWVGTSFIANYLAPVAPVPVIRIPPVLVPESLGSRETGRLRLNLSHHEFTFLFIFDFNSTQKRKNPLALIEAYKLAFKPSDPVRLIIKCVNEHANPDAFSEMQKSIQGYPITVLTGYWTGPEMRDLMAACDGYVSLHKSEGAGLTIADAMAHGKAVIATGWSGNMDFMNVSNSFPVAYELVELEENVGPYKAGEIWAQPSIEHAAQLMRQVLENPEDARARGLRAKATIERDFSAEAVGQFIQQRLGAIGIRRRFPAFQQEAKAATQRYQQLVKAIREKAARILPPDATVIVISKGDNELVTLNGCRAWHFPQIASGVYAGFYPPDSAAAIAQLEHLRSQGADFLVIPSTGFWWLEHYVAFREHLAQYKVLDQDENCIIVSLQFLVSLESERCK
jgi:glycosyltransferase involved in cell wall biosynthesis